MPLVIVAAVDWTLRAAVRAELLEKGVDAVGVERADDIAQLVAAGRMPSVVVMEADLPGADGPAAESLAQLAGSVPMLLVASRVTPAGPLAEKAAAIIFRPVRITDIVARVQQLLEGLPA